MTKKCVYCKKIFTGSNRSKFCTEDCFFKSRRKFEERACLICKNVFYPTKDSIKYCSVKCYNVARKANVYKPCLICGKPIKDLRRGRKKYCSNNCRYSAKTIYIPNHNLNACKWFTEFDRINRTSGQYAGHPEEFYIHEACAYVDYINHNLKLIIEWYERSHYRHGKLKQKDVERNTKILTIYSNYLFLAIKEFDQIKPFVLLDSEKSTYKYLIYGDHSLTL